MNYTWDIVLREMRGEMTGNPGCCCRSICTDSRSIKPGQMYVALAGERFDGHDFARSAIESGAVAVVVSHGRCRDIEPRIEVDDPLTAIQDLAAYARRQTEIPLTAITGSHGKTTTKDMLASILGQSRSVLATYQNLNGVIGVPLTLLNLEPFHQAIVIEVGISIPGEMQRLASIVQPDHAIFTCVAPAHSQFLPTLQHIANEKKKLMSWIRPGGHPILNADDPVIMQECRFPDTITFGLEGGDYRGRILTADPSGISFEVSEPGGHRHQYLLPCHGRHNVYNAMGAITAARLQETPETDVQKGLDSFNLSPHRSRIVQLPDLTVIDDTYNAAPNSMACAFRMLIDYPGSGRRIAVLGDMLELGQGSPDAHRRLGSIFADSRIDLLIAFGPDMRFMIDEVKKRGIVCHHFADNMEAARGLKVLLQSGDIVLVKASRSMHAEKIVEQLEILP